MNDTPRERFKKTLYISTGVSELLADSNTSYISWLETELATVTEQRDEAIIKYTGEANEFERQRNHAIAKCEDARRERDEAREQRDRLAEACKLLMATVGEPNSSADHCWVSEDEMDAAWNMGNEALQALNQNAKHIDRHE